jgi:hypothetical protein
VEEALIAQVIVITVAKDIPLEQGSAVAVDSQ